MCVRTKLILENLSSSEQTFCLDAPIILLISEIMEREEGSNDKIHDIHISLCMEEISFTTAGVNY
jgi:hypothetical protein